MRAIVFLVLLLAAVPALAGEERVARNGRNEVHVFDTECFHIETLLLVPPAMRLRYFKATAVIDGKAFFGCWTPGENGDELEFVWEDGDTGHVPVRDFKPVLNL